MFTVSYTERDCVMGAVRKETVLWVLLAVRKGTVLWVPLAVW